MYEEKELEDRIGQKFLLFSRGEQLSHFRSQTTGKMVIIPEKSIDWKGEKIKSIVNFKLR